MNIATSSHIFFFPIIKENISHATKKNWDLSYHSHVLWLWPYWRHSVKVREKQALFKKLSTFFHTNKFVKGVFLFPVSHLTKNIFLSSSKNLKKRCARLQTFLYIIFATFINEFFGLLNIPMSRSFSSLCCLFQNGFRIFLNIKTWSILSENGLE